jgi:adenylate cyclase
MRLQVACLRRPRPHPRGAITFLFADLVGFTALAEAAGDERAADVAGAFVREVDRLSCRHRARRVKALGDGVMVVCPTPERAVALATELVYRAREHPDLPPVRVAVHSGRAVRRGRDWFGHAVNVAARLAAAAAPDQVLVSDTTRRLLAGRHDFQAGRDLRLRGVRAPVRVWEAAAR